MRKTGNCVIGNFEFSVSHFSNQNVRCHDCSERGVRKRTESYLKTRRSMTLNVKPTIGVKEEIALSETLLAVSARGSVFSEAHKGRANRRRKNRRVLQMEIW